MKASFKTSKSAEKVTVANHLRTQIIYLTVYTCSVRIMQNHQLCYNLTSVLCLLEHPEELNHRRLVREKAEGEEPS